MEEIDLDIAEADNNGDEEQYEIDNQRNSETKLVADKQLPISQSDVKKNTNNSLMEDDDKN